MKNKKLILVLSFLLIICFTPLITSDPSFMVYNPKTDQIFTIGDNIISWNPPENVNHIRIELHKGFNRIKAIDTWVDNTGEFIWVIDENDTYEYGKDYRIKVLSSVNDDVYGWSNYFCINMYPLDIEVLAIIIISILLIIMIIIYYDKKTHKIQNLISKIIKKYKNNKKNYKKFTRNFLSIL